MPEPITTGVIVTGGASGIGAACARALAASGRPVAVWDLAGDAADAVARSLDVPSVGFGVDVADPDALAHAVATTRAALPTIGGLVHSAGVVVRAPIGEIDWDGWQRVLDVNLTAYARITQLLLPDLVAQEGSALVGISSIDGIYGHAGVPSYCSSKAGLIGLTRSLADALGARGVRANAVCPGYVETPMLGADPAVKDVLARRAVLGRVAQPDDIASVVRFLLSSDAAFVTGQAIAVDGGVTVVDEPWQGTLQIDPVP